MEDFEVMLNGGLGNQLFGWAAAVGISRRTGLSFTINASNTRERGYQLFEYGINASFSKPRVNLTPRNRLTRKLKRILTRVLPIRRFNFVENGFRFDHRFFDNPKNKTLYGYFQSPKYFEHAKSEVIKVLCNFRSTRDSYSELFKILSTDTYITVHVRRGDYIGLEHYHGLVSASYLSAARKLVLDQNPGAKFVVFSDSIKLAKFDFPDADLYVGEEVDLTPPELLSLMSSTQGIIGSNSSLSWWAGYLLQGEAPLRVYPEPWFSNKELDTQDLVPSDWKRLPSGF